MKKEPVNSEQRQYWLDSASNVNKVVYALYASCVLLFFADFTYHKHPHFEIESVFGFFCIFGFVSCVGLVLAAKVLRKILMRPEDYYDG